MTTNDAQPAAQLRTIADAVALARTQIVDDVLRHRVPMRVPDFSALHDYVDANTYGGMCDEGDASPSALLGHDAWNDYCNAITEQVDEWIRRGGVVADVIARREADAATAAGLDPAVDALEAAGLDVGVENTGGDWMVATLRSPDGSTVIAVLPEETQPGAWWIGLYTPRNWECGDEVSAYKVAEDLPTLVQDVRNVLAIGGL